jgi:cell division protein FtsI/penicillin-binding protein 2
MRNLSLLLIAGLLQMSPSDGRTAPAMERAHLPRATLFAQSSGQMLNRDFPNRDVSFLLLDAATGRVLASHWENPVAPIPLGSLVKPFTALAYGEHHAFRYPARVCRGTATGCWLPRGHGEVDLASAIAYSCNSYFRMLTARMTAADVSPTAMRFGLETPPPGAAGPALAGLGNRWLISPLNLARAYLELVRRRDQPGVRQILSGMEQSAVGGTGAEVDRALPFPDALAKTGTAQCTHAKRAPGDGFTIAMVPTDNPQLLLMVRVHGVPGAEAAKIAGQMLRRLAEGCATRE